MVNLRLLSGRIQAQKEMSLNGNIFFNQELSTLENKHVFNYYKFLIENIDLDRLNQNNSYIMWLCDKVDHLDKTKECNIKQAKTSMPDIDTDVPVEHRETITSYIRDKYGRDKVGHLATFGEMKGATAIKEVLRINDACSFEQMNELTRAIPEISKVADEMENTGEDSLLLFTLKYRPEKLQDWVRYNKETDSLEGDMAEWFKLAIKLEGTIQSIGKHASALAVFEEPLSNVCPMIHDKSGEEPMVGFDMKGAEKIGIVKLDLLGLSSLSKLLEVNNILKERQSYYQKLAKRMSIVS